MSETETPLLQHLDDVGVLTLTLNRPDCLNSFNDELSFALQDALKQAEKNKAVRCVVLTGSGRGFCAGQDLQSRNIQAQDNGRPSLGDSIRKRYSPIILKLHSMEKPTIAMVNGVAAGAGASLALACDLRIISDKASFIQAFVKVGLIPDSGSAWFLPRLIGLGKALELAMLGDKVDAETALRLGLVNRVVAVEHLEVETQALARQLAQGPTYAYGLIKRSFDKALSTDLETYLECEAQLQEIAGRTDDYQEGVQAFMEKRPAQFQGH